MMKQKSREREIDLVGQDNFRDLGGYPSSDGRSVRWGQLYRSGELSALSPADVEGLAQLGIRSVIDLRSRAEVESKGADRLPEGASLIPLPIDPGDLTPMVGPAFATGDFSSVPHDLLHEINRAYIREWRHQLRAVLQIVADPARRPVVFHCTQGKDRAGITAATLLSSLAVSWDHVVEDYLYSNRQRGRAAEEGLNQLRRTAGKKRGVPSGEVDMTNIRGLFFVDASYIGAAREEIGTLYGSVDAFLLEGIGCTPADLEQLREELLE